MSDYHFSVKQIKRSQGQSAIACAAYRAGEKLHSEYYDNDSDYTKKRGVITSGIILPDNAPDEYSDRETLWNSVEKVEKHPKAQLAYSFDFSLQNEFSMEENIEIAKEFIQKNFVDRGMIADYAVHLPETKDGGIPNPHVHVMCPIRPLKPDGSWGEKQHRVYRTDDSGNRIRDENGKELFDAVPSTDWGKPETLEMWRSKWAEINNAHFTQHGLDTRIDNRSFERQGLNQIPTVHEGPNVREMEKRGVVTDKGERNRWIRQINESMKFLYDRIRELVEWVKELNEILKEKPEPTVTSLVLDYMEQRHRTAWTQNAKVKHMKDLSRYRMYIETHKITTISDLERHINAVNEETAPIRNQFNDLKSRLKNLDDIEKAGNRYTDVKEVYNEWYRIFFKKKKESFGEEHRKELNTYYATKKKLTNAGYMDENDNFDISKLNRDRKLLMREIEEFNTEHAAVSEQIKTLNEIKKAIDQVKRTDSDNTLNTPVTVNPPIRRTHNRDDIDL